jgi:alkylhydroperoxidase/carboxymuconolactone decarboxylase family protein YurZ
MTTPDHLPARFRDQRLPLLAPDELTPAQRTVYDRIVEGRAQTKPVDGAGRLTGPFNAMLYGAAVGDALQALGATIRFNGLLSGRCREIAILIVAVDAKSPYELMKHTRAALAVGLNNGELAAITCGDDQIFTDEKERAVIAVTRLLITTGDLTDSEYRLAEDVLGPGLLVELSALTGYYQLLALQLRLFRVPLRQDAD